MVSWLPWDSVLWYLQLNDHGFSCCCSTDDTRDLFRNPTVGQVGRGATCRVNAVGSRWSCFEIVPSAKATGSGFFCPFFWWDVVQKLRRIVKLILHTWYSKFDFYTSMYFKDFLHPVVLVTLLQVSHRITVGPRRYFWRPLLFLKPPYYPKDN